MGNDKEEREWGTGMVNGKGGREWGTGTGNGNGEWDEECEWGSGMGNGNPVNTTTVGWRSDLVLYPDLPRTLPIHK